MSIKIKSAQLSSSTSLLFDMDKVYTAIRSGTDLSEFGVYDKTRGILLLNQTLFGNKDASRIATKTRLIYNELMSTVTEEAQPKGYVTDLAKVKSIATEYVQGIWDMLCNSDDVTLEDKVHMLYYILLNSMCKLDTFVDLDKDLKKTIDNMKVFCRSVGIRDFSALLKELYRGAIDSGVPNDIANISITFNKTIFGFYKRIMFEHKYDTKAQSGINTRLYLSMIRNAVVRYIVGSGGGVTDKDRLQYECCENTYSDSPLISKGLLSLLSTIAAPNLSDTVYTSRSVLYILDHLPRNNGALIQLDTYTKTEVAIYPHLIAQQAVLRGGITFRDYAGSVSKLSSIVSTVVDNCLYGTGFISVDALINLNYTTFNMVSHLKDRLYAADAEQFANYVCDGLKNYMARNGGASDGYTTIVIPNDIAFGKVYESLKPYISSCMAHTRHGSYEEFTDSSRTRNCLSREDKIHPADIYSGALWGIGDNELVMYVTVDSTGSPITRCIARVESADKITYTRWYGSERVVRSLYANNLLTVVERNSQNMDGVNLPCVVVYSEYIITPYIDMYDPRAEYVGDGTVRINASSTKGIYMQSAGGVASFAFTTDQYYYGIPVGTEGKVKVLGGDVLDVEEATYLPYNNVYIANGDVNKYTRVSELTGVRYNPSMPTTSTVGSVTYKGKAVAIYSDLELADFVFMKNMNTIFDKHPTNVDKNGAPVAVDCVPDLLNEGCFITAAMAISSRFAGGAISLEDSVYSITYNDYIPNNQVAEFQAYVKQCREMTIPTILNAIKA